MPCKLLLVTLSYQSYFSEHSLFTIFSHMQHPFFLVQGTDAEEQPESDGSSSEGAIGTDGGGLVSVVSSMIGSAVRHLSGDDLSIVTLDGTAEYEKEKQFEAALSHQFV